MPGAIAPILIARLVANESSTVLMPLASLNAQTAIFSAGRADVAKFSAVKFYRVRAQQLLQNQRSGPSTDGQPIRLGSVVKMVAKNDAAGAHHVVDDDGGISRNIFTDMARDQSGKTVKQSSRGIADDELDGLPLVKFFALSDGWRSTENHKRPEDGRA